MYSSEENSPVKPTIIPTLKEGLVIFHYKKSECQNKTMGLSPNGKTKIQLTKHEGESHNRARYKSLPIISGDSPIKSPNKQSPLSQVLRLVIMLKNLKNRVDSDCLIFKLEGEVDSNHFAFTTTEIKACINQLKRCYTFCKEKKLLVKELNSYINEAEIYNPFSLKKLYTATGYDFEVACQNFNQKLDVADICDTDEKKQTIALSALTETSPNLKKREHPNSNTLFQPRSVRMKRENMDNRPNLT